MSGRTVLPPEIHQEKPMSEMAMPSIICDECNDQLDVGEANLCYVCAATLRHRTEAAEARAAELETQARDTIYIQSDWERAHELLDAAGVLTASGGAMGAHLIDRIQALISVWDPVGRLSATSCHDLRFLCNTPEEAIEAIKAHRAAFRPGREAVLGQP